jgi:hypothetical protein
MQQRRGTAEQWTSSNPVLSPAEVGFETDNNQFKIGDGVNTWNNLPYFLNEDGISGSLEDYVAITEKGAANGVASLDSTGNVPFTQLGNIVDGAPGVLNTLNELAAAIGDDASFLTTISTSIATKQDKVTNVSDTEIGYLDGVTSAIQTQLNAKAATSHTHAQADITNLTTDLAAKAPLADPTFTGTVSGVTKTHVGLGNVDNTSDADKPVSTATQTALDAKLASATAASTYETITNVSLKAPLESPALTGTPTAPTATAGTNTTQVATTAFVSTAVSNIIDSAPGALDTLNELAAAINDDASYAATVTTALGNKQDKVANVSDTEIGYLDGVTSSIQTQIDAKANTGHTQNASTIITTVTDKSSEYTILAADENTFIRSTSATAVTMTIDNVLAIGESVQFIQFGAGQITFAAGSGVALRSVDNKLKSNKQYSVVAITCVASGEYLVTGDVAA